MSKQDPYPSPKQGLHSIPLSRVTTISDQSDTESNNLLLLLRVPIQDRVEQLSYDYMQGKHCVRT
jgi:hypothetical protein